MVYGRCSPSFVFPLLVDSIATSLWYSIFFIKYVIFSRVPWKNNSRRRFNYIREFANRLIESLNIWQQLFIREMCFQCYMLDFTYKCSLMLSSILCYSSGWVGHFLSDDNEDVILFNMNDSSIQARWLFSSGKLHKRSLLSACVTSAMCLHMCDMEPESLAKESPSSSTERSCFKRFSRRLWRKFLFQKCCFAVCRGPFEEWSTFCGLWTFRQNSQGNLWWEKPLSRHLRVEFRSDI